MFNFKPLFTPALIAITLTGCNDSDYDDSDMMDDTPMATEYQYQVTVKNLTNAQPLSPIAAILHSTGEIWQLGEMASAELESLAESGDHSGVMGADFVIESASNDNILMPGAQVEIMLTTSDETASLLSLATMLVNTNDAFSGLNQIDLSLLEVDAMLSFNTAVYDSGTEANSESAGTIPGPADVGEGFNAMRDDVDFVSRHSGVVSADDGLTSSVLNNQHKFDNPAMSVKIVRTQ